MARSQILLCDRAQLVVETRHGRTRTKRKPIEQVAVSPTR